MTLKVIHEPELPQVDDLNGSYLMLIVIIKSNII